MNTPFEPKKIVDWSVGDIFQHNKKYAFRIYLTYDDEKVTQECGGFSKRADATKERDLTVTKLYNKTFVPRRKATVGEYLPWWLDYFKDHRIPTENTYAIYEKSIRLHIIPVIGKVDMRNLSHGILLKALNTIKTQSSTWQATMAACVLRAAMTEAFKLNLTETDLSVDLKLPRKKDEPKKPYRRRILTKEHTLTLEQVCILLSAARVTPIFLPILLAVTLGLRRGEMLGLKYSDIDVDTKIIHIQRQLGKPLNEPTEYEKGMKNKQELPLKTKSSDRYIVLPDFVYEYIMEEKARYDAHKNRRKMEFRDYGFICCSSYGLPRSGSFLFPNFKPLLQENGLPNIRWHDLRNSYATLLCDNGFSLKAIACTLGHATEIVTDENYINKKVINIAGSSKIEEAIDELLGGFDEIEKTQNNLVDFRPSVKIEDKSIQELLG